MARSVIANGQPYSSVRAAINTMTADLYGYKRNVADWGVSIGASGAANSNAINQAIQDAMDDSFGLTIDPGFYSFDSCILFGRIVSGQWQARQLPTLESSVYSAFPNNDTVANYAFPVLRATFNDAPLIAIQGGQGASLRGLQLRGAINPTVGAAYLAADNLDILEDVSLWNNGQRQNRYSPSCVVAIDPFGSVTPSGDRYPGVPSSYYTMTDSYSTGVTIANCIIAYAEVGLLCGAGVSSNTDGIVTRDCQFSRLVYAVSVCHAQSKNHRLENSSVYVCFGAVAMSKHGSQNGFCPQIHGMSNSSFIGKMFVDVHPGSLISVVGGHVEVLGTIGDFGASLGTSEPVSMTDMSIIFAGTRSNLSHIKSGRPTRIANCALSGDAGPIRVETSNAVDLHADWLTGYRGNIVAGEMVFENTKFSGATRTSWANTLVVTAGTPNAKQWVRFENCMADVTLSGEYDGRNAALNGRAGTLGF